MNKNRAHKAKLNIVVSLASQVITLLCGLIVPGMMIRAFGSEVYGATTSIAQFLAYITLLEGGIGGVARAALYKPLADLDSEKISTVVGEIRSFFRVIGYIFSVYVLVLAFTFKTFSGIECMEWISTAVLVVVISISTFAQYFIGISNTVLLQAAQMSYVTQGISIAATILNTVLVIFLIQMNADIITVKLVSSIVFVLRPVTLDLYVRNHFNIKKIKPGKEKYLVQKWNGLSQHIAYFLHSNTDIAILTLLANLRAVAVYSVYNMVIAHMQNLAASFLAGMEALFGDMLAKQETEQLNDTIDKYEMIIAIVGITLFATTAVLIVPFVKLYTSGITDADYHAPFFALIMVLSSVIYCLRMPYHSLIIAAGHFKRTQMAAYGEAVINIGLSILLVRRMDMVGVAIGTITATSFRFLYYALYLSKNIINRPLWMTCKRLTVNILAFSAAVVLGNGMLGLFSVSNYFVWIVCGVVSVIVSGATVVAVNLLTFRSVSMKILDRLRHT